VGKAGDKSVESMVDAFRVFFVGIVLIVIAVQATGQLLANQPLETKILVYGILSFFVYSMRNKIKNSINQTFQKRR